MLCIHIKVRDQLNPTYKYENDDTAIPKSSQLLNVIPNKTDHDTEMTVRKNSTITSSENNVSTGSDRPEKNRSTSLINNFLLHSVTNSDSTTDAPVCDENSCKLDGNEIE